MNIYISAPITGRTKDDIEFCFAYAKTQLEYYGHKTVNPYAIGKMLPELTHDQYLAIDDAILLHGGIDAVYFFAGWRESEGCRHEHRIAEELGLVIFEDISEVAHYGN